MNSHNGFLGARVGFLRWAIAAGAVVLIVTTTSTVLWAGSAIAASDSAAASPVKVKYFVVPPPRMMPAESLYQIAVETLGAGSRYPQIFALNKGRLQPGGGRLENPRLIEPGWVLQLPADAVGPGVHFGPLPTVTVKAVSRPVTVSPPPSVSPSRLMTSKARTSDSLVTTVLVAGTALFVVAVAALAFSANRRRTADRRGDSEASASTLISGDPWIGSPNQPWPRAESRLPESDYPSWPGRPGPYALHPDHPSWPGRPDPRWAATEAHLRTSDFPSWPERQASPAATSTIWSYARPAPEPAVKADTARIRPVPGRHRVPARDRP